MSNDLSQQTTDTAETTETPSPASVAPDRGESSKFCVGDRVRVGACSPTAQPATVIGFYAGDVRIRWDKPRRIGLGLFRTELVPEPFVFRLEQPPTTEQSSMRVI